MFVVLYSCPIRNKKVKGFTTKKLHQVFFNVILTTIDGTFLVILLMAAINIKQYASGVIEINSSLFWSVWAVAVFTAELILVSIFLFTNRTRLDDDPRLKKRCGYVFEGMNYKIRGSKALAYFTMYQVRFVLLVFVILFMQNSLVIQCICISLSSIILMAFLGFNKPYSDLSLNIRGIFDEYVIIIVLDFLLISSNPVLDAEMRLDIGWCVIAILGAEIFLAQALILYASCKTLK